MTDESDRRLMEDPAALEAAYRQAARAGREAAFAAAIEAAYAQDGKNVLLAAWHHRLAAVAEPVTGSAGGRGGAAAVGRGVAWGWALLAGGLNGLLLWLLSDDKRFTLQVINPLTGFAHTVMPAIALLAAPISAALIVMFLTLASRTAPLAYAGRETGVKRRAGREAGVEHRAGRETGVEHRAGRETGVERGEAGGGRGEAGAERGEAGVERGEAGGERSEAGGSGRGRRWLRPLAVALGLAACAAYVLLLYPRMWPRLFQEQFLGVMVLHLGLLAWAGVGVVALARQGDQLAAFAFLVKSLEAFVVGGLLAIAGGLFTGITTGLFAALGIELPVVVQRLFLAGGGGLIIVVAVALVYHPDATPAQQSFDEGLSKVVALLMRLLLPLTVAVLVVYLAFIPFNWREPFENRDVLMIFSAMLFAVVALLVGATPVHEAELGEKAQTWLRRGTIALASLALVVGIYALAAIVYRTANAHLTPNRLLFIGWNLVNIAVLAILLVQQARAGRPQWLAAMRRAFAAGIVLYLAWSAAGLLATPWLFRGAPKEAAGLPERVQQLIYEQPEPILLKCPTSPHIYLLEEGRKHWVKDIPTFEAEGYRWNDVSFVGCADLRAVPDGQPIPPDAGPPPQP